MRRDMYAYGNLYAAYHRPLLHITGHSLHAQIAQLYISKPPIVNIVKWKDVASEEAFNNYHFQGIKSQKGNKLAR